MSFAIGDPVTVPGRGGVYTVVDVDEARGHALVVPAGECWAHTPRRVPIASLAPAGDAAR